MTRKSKATPLPHEPLHLRQLTPEMPPLLEALEQVMRDTEGHQNLPDLLRRLQAQNVVTTAAAVVEAVLTEREIRAIGCQPQRFGISADKQISWVGEGARSVRAPTTRRRTAKAASSTPKSKAISAAVTEAASQPKAVSNSRKAMLKQLLALTPTEFERLCARLITAMGVHDVQATSPQNDAGVDVRGVLVIEDLIRIRVAVQVKRYKNNVQRPEVQKLRGSLSHGEVGWFMTTGDYSPGAREEAKATDRQPISLMNGLEVADLVMKYSVPLHEEPA